MVSPLAGARDSIGLFTRLPVSRSRTAQDPLAALTWAGPIGSFAALVASVPLWVSGWMGWPTTLLAATTTVAALAYLTRGLHLDGVADMADGLGASVDDERGLQVMRRSDIGPFGVLALVFLVLGQVGALLLLEPQVAAAAFVSAAWAGRTVLLLACRRGVAAARPEGLGAWVAGTVSATRVVLLLSAAAIVGGLLLVAVGIRGWAVIVAMAVSLTLAVVIGLLLVATAQRRFGGITGDVLGAVIEWSALAALVGAAVVLSR